MRQVLRLLGNRYGAALVLVVVIGLVVTVARLAGGPARIPLPAGTGAARPLITVSAEPPDGQDSPEPADSPSTSPGAAAPLAVAASFTAAWLHHTGVTAAAWLAGMRPYCTDSLATELTGVDPAGVPATATTGPATLVPHDAGFAQVQVPLDAGTLTLRLLASAGRWLVDGVDWHRS